MPERLFACPLLLFFFPRMKILPAPVLPTACARPQGEAPGWDATALYSDITQNEAGNAEPRSQILLTVLLRVAKALTYPRDGSPLQGSLSLPLPPFSPAPIVEETSATMYDFLAGPFERPLGAPGIWIRRKQQTGSFGTRSRTPVSRPASHAVAWRGARKLRSRRRLPRLPFPMLLIVHGRLESRHLASQRTMHNTTLPTPSRTAQPPLM